jgi:SecD/SecF fusion protein
MKKRSRIVAFFLIVLLFASLISTTVLDISKKINLGLDLQGGFEILYEVEPVDQAQEVNRQLLEATVQTLNDRVNRLGISETVIDIEGEDRIRVQLAGVEDQEQARAMLSTSALLTFRDVNDNVLLDGTDIVEGSARQDFHAETNQPIVTLKLKDSNKFGEVTEEVAKMRPENLLVIWMDFEEGDSFYDEVDKAEPKFISNPSVEQPLYTNDVMITGKFTVEDAQYLADIINSGSLPVHMHELFSTSVGAQFGEKALTQTVFAGIVGLIIVLLYMIVIYRFPGVIAGINLLIYTYLILLVFQLLNGVLTLPGIAALILGIGMAVDANVLMFERVKEELRLGKSVKMAFKAGSKNSLRTILDANITTILVAIVLFYFGTSSVKGFATMLIVSIVISFLTSVYGTRWLLGLWVNSGFLDKRKGWFAVKEAQIQDIADDEELEPTIFGRSPDIIRQQKKIFIISIIVVIVGATSLAIFKINPGVDFTSGSRIEIVTDEPISSEQIEEDFSSINLEPKSIVLSGENNEGAVTRFDTVLTEQQMIDVRQYFSEKYNHEPNVSIVSPIVGQELVKNAIYAVLISLIGLIIYVTFRFELFFSFTAIVALTFDVFFALVVFSITRLEFDITIIAALLTIIGYSLNNTIVVFDRIRENIRKKNKLITSKKELAKIINNSLIQTFIRNINTTTTTLVVVFAFMILGAQSIFGFAIAIVVGLIAGTYSSLFLASQLWLVWRGKDLKKRPLDFRKKKRVEGPQV